MPHSARVTSLIGRVRSPWVERDRALSVLIILSHSPLDGDTTWNALRLASTLQVQWHHMRIFVMNDAIDLVRQGSTPEGAEFDLSGMLRGLLPKGGRVRSARRVLPGAGCKAGM